MSDVKKISSETQVEKDWDSVKSLLQEYANNYSKKGKEYEDFTLKRFKEKYEGIPIDISKELILQIAQLNDDMSILEDKMLNIARGVIDENVIWIHQGRRGRCKEPQIVQDLISEIKEKRNDRYYEILGFCNSLAKRDMELWKEFNKYMDSLNVSYDSEEVRNGGREKHDATNIPLNSLDYWTDWR